MKKHEEILVDSGVFKDPKVSNFNLIIHRDCYILAQENILKAMNEAAKEAFEAGVKWALEGDFNGVMNVDIETFKDYLKELNDD